MTIPCKECITFAVCKAQYDTLLRKISDRPYMARIVLESKCILLKNHIDQLIDNTNFGNATNSFHRFMQRNDHGRDTQRL